MSDLKKDPVFRVDKFKVPTESREEFLALVGRTHDVLRQQAGFAGDRILEQESGPGSFNFVTIVEWADASFLAGAGAVVAEMHRSIGFDKAVAFPRLGIVPDMANYRALQL